MRNLKVDVLVIGSGMGGMSAAALLAKVGYRVFVAERMPQIGGRCSTIECNGYKCPSGVVAIEMNGVVRGLFESTEAEFDVTPVGPPFYLIKGKPFQVPKKGGMKALLMETGAEPAAIEKVMSAMSKAINWKEPSPGISLLDWVSQYSDDSAVTDIFQSMVQSALMVKIDKISAQFFFEFIKTLKGPNEFGYCNKGSGTLPEALGRVVLQNGGEIWTDSTVTKIRVDKGVVQGAILRHQGREFQIDAQIIISDTGPRTTVELAGEKEFDLDYLQELEDKLKPTAAICIQLGLNAPLFESNHLMLTNTKRVYVIYQPTKSCPGLAPKGKHLLVANAFPKSMEALLTKEGRQKEVDKCLDELSQLFPELKKSATLLKTQVYKDFWPGLHSRPGNDLPIKTPVINLYNVGDGVKPSGYGSLAAVVKTGMMVADEVRQRMPCLVVFQET